LDLPSGARDALRGAGLLEREGPGLLASQGAPCLRAAKLFTFQSAKHLKVRAF